MASTSPSRRSAVPPRGDRETELILIETAIPRARVHRPCEHLATAVDGVSLHPQLGDAGTAARDLVVARAQAVRAVRRLPRHAGSRRDPPIHRLPGCQPGVPRPAAGPARPGQPRTVSTHFQPGWSRDCRSMRHGERGSIRLEPFEVPMQGLGVFACRRDAWRGFNPRLAVSAGRRDTSTRSFARQAIARCVCHSFVGCTASTDRSWHRIGPAGRIASGTTTSGSVKLASRIPHGSPLRSPARRDCSRRHGERRARTWEPLRFLRDHLLHQP